MSEAGPLGGAGGGGHHLLLIVIVVAVLARFALGAWRSRRRSFVPVDERRPEAARDLPPVSAEPFVAPTTVAAAAVVAAKHSVLLVSDLTVAYGAKTAVDQLSFEIRSGEIFGLLGPNGAGKTSTLSAIEGLVRPRRGTVFLDGIDVRANAAAARASLGVQLQATSFQAELSITELIRLYAGLYGVTLTGPQIVDRLTTAGLASHAGRAFRQLSGGQQQRLSLLVALIHDPVLLLLDEPTTGLDPQARRQLWRRIEAVRDTGGSILLTTHSMEEAQAVCDRVAIVDGGRLLALDAPRALIDQHRSDPLVRAAAHGVVTLEDVFIGLTGGEIRD